MNVPGGTFYDSTNPEHENAVGRDERASGVFNVYPTL